MSEAEAAIGAGELRMHVDLGDKNGWCGLGDLRHREQGESWLLSPALTLEHYIGVPHSASDYVAYEPCMSPKTLRDVTPEGCTLDYAPRASCHIACSIAYRVTPPHYVDVAIEARSGREEWRFREAALFFATIVRAPVYTGVTLRGRDTGVDVRGGNPWHYFNGFASLPGRTVHPARVAQPELRRADDAPPAYFYDDSSLRFEEPFFFGRIEQMVFALLFPPDERENVRFVINPLAPAFGGPAWDFFWVLRDPSPERVFRLPLRVMWKPFVSDADVLREYETYAAGVGRS